MDSHGLFCQQAFDFEFFPANAGRFIPMYFSLMDCIIWKAHGCDAFEFAPATSTVEFSQPGKVSN